MPRVRFGQVHCFNNYYNGNTSGGYCAGVGNECQIRLDNNYYDNVKEPWKNYHTSEGSGIAGKIGWNTGNQFVNGTTIPTWATNDYDTIFIPPYSYTLDAGADVKAIVMAGVGAGVFYGDLDRSNTVDFNDLEIFTGYWLANDCNQIAGIDYDGNCNINNSEFALFAENWMYTPDVNAPAAPTGLVATAGDSTVSLDWDDNDEPDSNGYNVYRSETFGSGYTKLNGSLLTNSNYTDNTVVNETVYFYAVTAVDKSNNESVYSNKVSAIPLGAGSIVIQEDTNYTNGFCGVDGTIYNTPYTGYTGTGYCKTPLAVGNGIDWSISVPSDSTYTFKWRYSLASGSRTPRLLVNDLEVAASISFPATNDWSIWDTVSQEVSLTAGTNNIRLESTGSGLAAIDYIMITGDSPAPTSCP
jgi:hypothetical protein